VRRVYGAILKSSRSCLHNARAFLCAQRLLFARLFFVRSIFYSRNILKISRILFARLSLCAAFSYSRAILKSSRFLFARLSLCAEFFFWVCPMEHLNRSSVHLPAIVHGGERQFVQEDFVSDEYSPLLLSHEPTLWYRCHQLFGLGAPYF